MFVYEKFEIKPERRQRVYKKDKIKLNNQKIFLKDLHSKTDEEELKYYFGKYGKIHSVHLFKKHGTNISRRIAHVTFIDQESARVALKFPNSHVIDGVNITIEPCLSKKEIKNKKNEIFQVSKEKFIPEENKATSSKNI